MGKVLELDKGDGYMSVYNCQDALKMGMFYCI